MNVEYNILLYPKKCEKCGKTTHHVINFCGKYYCLECGKKYFEDLEI